MIPASTSLNPSLQTVLYAPDEQYCTEKKYVKTSSSSKVSIKSNLKEDSLQGCGAMSWKKKTTIKIQISKMQVCLTNTCTRFYFNEHAIIIYNYFETNGWFSLPETKINEEYIQVLAKAP